MSDISEDLNWYAVSTRSRHEKKSAAMLAGKVDECFLPLATTRSRRKDRKAYYEKVLIPGYVFVRNRMDSSALLEILKTPGVVKVVKAKLGSENRPCPIPDEQIDSLKVLLASSAEVTPFTDLKVGERVEVVSGPFMGAIGELIRLAPNRNRLVVRIDILNQSVSVDIDVDDIQKID